MLRDTISLDQFLKDSPRELAERCKIFTDDQVLVEALIDQRLLSRDQLCAILDVGESTLSGWIKQRRLPQMAKLSYVLLNVALKMREEVSRLREEAADRKIVADGDRFLVCEFTKNGNGETIGRVIQSVDSIECARELASLPKLLRLLESSKWFADEYANRLREGNPEAAGSIEQYLADVENISDYLADAESSRVRQTSPAGTQADTEELLSSF